MQVQVVQDVQVVQVDVDRIISNAFSYDLKKKVRKTRALTNKQCVITSRVFERTVFFFHCM